MKVNIIVVSDYGTTFESDRSACLQKSLRRGSVNCKASWLACGQKPNGLARWAKRDFRFSFPSQARADCFEMSGKGRVVLAAESLASAVSPWDLTCFEASPHTFFLVTGRCQQRHAKAVRRQLCVLCTTTAICGYSDSLGKIWLGPLGCVEIAVRPIRRQARQIKAGLAGHA